MIIAPESKSNVRFALTDLYLFKDEPYHIDFF
ncbi:hypothetical protein SAMN05421863_101334 [Nitrosomonas communis]|uniref:Uncharacterized protein n=1 Tax=Nitrosomonas communis TaxID=44574 RepID=A0A1I4N5W1_9PROT|nr:hypothetical protein SAMN05421863_101334 [Nitrosomonas communis]